MKNELVTVADHLHWAESLMQSQNCCFGHGTDNAWDEAVFLLMTVMKLPHDSGKELLPVSLTDDQHRRFMALIQSRIEKRIPASYLVQRGYFAGLEFFVDSRVLVPRSPFAELIQNHFEPWVDGSSLKYVLDCCTGSGCMAIATAVQLPFVAVDAVDLSQDALLVAKMNADHHHVSDRVRFIHSDVFDALKADGKRYDLIISNPPYVPLECKAELPQEYHHEPAMGLFASDHGLAIVKRILEEALMYLTADGVLMVEAGETAEALEQVYPHFPFIWVDLENGGEGIFVTDAKTLNASVSLLSTKGEAP